MLIDQLLTRVRGKAGQFHQLLTVYARQKQFSGSVLVAQGGRILFQRGYGYANLEHQAKNTPQTVFRIGSMTKPFTALAIMQQVEAGHLNVTDPISRFFPDFPNGERITVHHLLSNTSGIANYLMLPIFLNGHRQPLTTAELIAGFRDEPPRFEPGTEFHYSNSNWVLLGAILEQLEGKPYGQVIDERIFQPAGMSQSGFDWTHALIPQRATGYDNSGAALQQAEPTDSSAMHGAGGLHSTVTDLYHFDQALRDNRLVSPATLRQMTTPVTTHGELHYGYGWTLQTFHRHQAVGHSGGLYGFIGHLLRFPEDDAVVIFLSNFSGIPDAEITRDLTAILFDAPYALPHPRQFIELDPAVYAPYVGDYRFSFAGQEWMARFLVAEGSLHMEILGWTRSVLKPLSPTTFYTRSKGDVEMTFVSEAGSPAQRIEMDWGGHHLVARRMNNPVSSTVQGDK